MNELIKTMATDMSIYPYKGETLSSFTYRVIYSGLGQWCLKSAYSYDGITKHAQTALLNELIDRYIKLFPDITEKLIQEGQTSMPVFIRRLYEETGYLIMNSSNRNNLVNYRRGLRINSKYLYFGIGDKKVINGLGVFSDDAKYSITWRELLIRDNLNYEKYLLSKFNPVYFDKRDISPGELQFFDPKAEVAPSSSWINEMVSEKTIARNPVNRMFYRVMRQGDEILYCDEIQNPKSDELISFEYRRLYFALKKYYLCPLKAWIKSIDNRYSKLTLGGHLPNREYYFLLLCSWPEQMYCNKREFIIKKDYLSIIREILGNIGIDIIGG